jgi:hypothetical protein
MDMLDRGEPGRSVVSSLAASVLGVMTGALFIGGDPVGSLGLIGFTFTGAFAILLPLFLWLRSARRCGLAISYLIILGAGAAGGFLMLLILWYVVGGRDELRDPTWLCAIGSIFGLTTAIWWIASHATLALRD